MKILFCLMFVLFTFAFSQNSSPNSPPNIIWLVAEDISPALGCYGDNFATTPNIDRLASQGLIFDNAFATAPICAPSRSCLMSGLYATSLGTQHLRCEIPFPQHIKTLPELLKKAGYFTSNRDKTDYNFDPEGRWEHWSSSLTPWRENSENRPFFSFINIGPSHEGSVNSIESYKNFTKNLPATLFHDPNKVIVPPYYPDSPGTRKVWAHYYDIMTILDQNVGAVLDSLKKDGLMENTIIFFFGDHGFGMPRYKRWLYRTGLNVPLVIYVPEKYKHLSKYVAGAHTDELVSFVDFVPTVLNLAGVSIPEDKEGQPFLGVKIPEKREYIFAARDRADDMFEMSRAVFDGQYLYIRHYLPHLPFIQSGYIYSDVKHAYRELRQLYLNSKCNAEQLKLWQPKPVEELYDLLNDPQELNNLVKFDDYHSKKLKLAEVLQKWMTEHKDLGLLAEAEYMIRAGQNTPYEYARSKKYDVKSILKAAEMVGTSDESSLAKKLLERDSGVRFWAVVGLRQLDKMSQTTAGALTDVLNDPSPSVQIMAAEVLCHFQDNTKAVATLGKWVKDDQPWLALQAARSIQLVGEKAKPLIPIMYQVLEKNLGEPGAQRKYKDFNYAAFTSWALEWALQELGEDIKVN